MNPESLDSSIQSALSALFPPFEATASVVLCQLFRTIEERYHGDALHCLLDFLIPSKHLLESVQQAACATYSDVLFRCEGWPLCLHDKTVIQLAPLNPLLLRPGDFYLQVEPFGDQAARIVLKCLLEEGCREVDETPIPETSYPCIFTEDWLQEINEGRHGTRLSRCLLSTDQGIIKLPWVKVAIPEFLDKPKTMPTPSVTREAPVESKHLSVPSHFNSSTLPLENMILPSRDRISVSLRLGDSSSKLIKMERDKRVPKILSTTQTKPVGWVSPNTWDSRNYREIEGDYVDLVDFAKEKEALAKVDSTPSPTAPLLFKPVRPPPPIPTGNSAPCGRTLKYSAEPCTPCSQRKLGGHEPTDQELKCRYRDSYMAALRNPVPFEKGSVDLLAALDEVGLSEELESGSQNTNAVHRDEQGTSYNHCDEATISHEPQENGQCCETTMPPFVPPHKQPPSGLESGNAMRELPVAHILPPGGDYSQEAQRHPISHQVGHNSKGHLMPGAPPQPPHEACDGSIKAFQMAEAIKPSGKHKAKLRSLSTVSEIVKGSPLLHKANNRSYSDICPEMIPNLLKCQKDTDLGLVVSPKMDRRHCSKKGKGEIPPTTNGPDSKPHHNSKTDKPLCLLQVEKASSISDVPLSSPPTQQSSFRDVSGLLQLGIICLPGGRDKTGRAVVEVHAGRKEWTSPLVSAPGVCRLLLYLHAIPRQDVRDLGMTLVIDARKKTPSPLLYKALLMAQEQALHAVHSILMLVEKDTCPRPERQPGLQMDVVTSMKALNKMVEVSQLTSDLGGTFTYSHADWMQFHQRLLSFMADLQGADSLLQRAIKKVDGTKTMNTTQDVQLCISVQRTLMKEVLEDTRLVTLQREGGAMLARMKKEEFRFPQSEDYRDAMESMTALYNQVEEKLHTLVMRSNESLQCLDFLYKLREMEGQINTVGTWFSVEGEQTLKDSNITDNDSLASTEKALLHFECFLTQAKERKQQALTLVADTENIVGAHESSPETDVFQIVVSTFKSNMEEFLMRAEQKHKELDRMVHLYRFCEQASALAKECSHYLEQVETGCYSVKASQSTLKTYEERLGGEFSASHFQAAKAKVCCSGGSGASAGTRVWNAAWAQCQRVRQCLEERQQQKKKAPDKGQIQNQRQAAAAVSQGKRKALERDEEWREGAGEAGLSLARDSICPKGTVNNSEGGPEERGAVIPSLNLHLKPDLKEKRGAKTPRLPKTPAKDERHVIQNDNDRVETKWRLREHHSEADLSRVDSVSRAGEEELPLGHALGRSLSEGSGTSTRLMAIFGFSPLSTRHNQCEMWSHPLVVRHQTSQNLPISRQDSFCSGHSCCESNKESNAEECGPKGSSVPTHQSPGGTSAQEASLSSHMEQDAINVLKLQKIMEELVSTEREYVRALGYVREQYFPELERPDVPQDLRGQRGSIFGNLEKLHDFHRHHFLKELEGCVKDPFRVGRCFLRHRESFALYALYSKNKPQSDRLLINHGQSFFKQKQLQLGDKMDLWSYLLKPVQRISKYSLLLQDMVRECGPGQTKEMAEVQAALEVINFQLRHGNNLLAMDDIHNCDVNLKEQGQLIRQDEFLVSFRKKKCFRHIFLFQELILFSKTKKTDVGNETYIYKQSFKTSDVGMTHNSGDSGLCFEIWFRRRKSQDTYVLQADSRQVKEAWTKDLERILWEQAARNREVRMQERVFLGIGNKPFMDIQPSDAAINDRAINYVLMGRENKALCTYGMPGGGLPVMRPNSIGSGSTSSSSGSHSSSSSGRGSLSPMGYLCGPKQRVSAGGPDGYVAPPGVLEEEDDLDHENGSQNLLMDSSESSGESVSGLSSSGHSYHGVIPEDTEDTSSVCTSTTSTIKEAALPLQTEATPPPHIHKPPDTPTTRTPEKTPPPVAPKPKSKSPYKTKGPPCGKVENPAVGKSTEV